MLKKYRWIAVAAACMLIATIAMIVCWPRDDGSLEVSGPLHDVGSLPVKPTARFERATVLTAARPSTALPQERFVHAQPNTETQLSAFSDDPPISFMPDRLALSENGQWQNGWDEPVTELGDELLTKLPDLSTAAEWLAPAKPVAEPVSVSDPPVVPLPEPTAAPDEEAASEDATYTIQADDTLWTISQKVYGTGALFVALAEHNRESMPDPHALEIGQALATPPAEWLARQYPHLCPAPNPNVVDKHVPTLVDVRRPEYAVQPGDTLEKIAVVRLGRADRWREILALNHHIVGASGGYLTPGLILSLPDDARSAATVLRPTDRLRN